jgi:hypothetical protein
MKSQMANSLTLIDAEAALAMFEAVRNVAEQSFFAVAEPGDQRSFDGRAAGVPLWLTASVAFERGAVKGIVSCTLPADLVGQLFDAFTGRDPSEPLPEPGEIHDLVGEFSNMVCGAWLTRIATSRAFTLHRPSVESMAVPPSPDGRGLRVLAAIDDLPVAVDLCMHDAAA